MKDITILFEEYLCSIPQLNLTEDPLPVMVWIHGGAFYIGSGNGDTDMFGPNYILNRDVVLVTMNYRLGPLGIFIFEFSISLQN